MLRVKTVAISILCPLFAGYLAKRCDVSVATSLFPAFTQGLLVLFVCVAGLLAHTAWQPFRRPASHLLQRCSPICLDVTAAYRLFSAARSQLAVQGNDDMRAEDGYAAATIAVGYLIPLLLFLTSKCVESVVVGAVNSYGRRHRCREAVGSVLEAWSREKINSVGLCACTGSTLMKSSDLAVSILLFAIIRQSTGRWGTSDLYGQPVRWTQVCRKQQQQPQQQGISTKLSQVNPWQQHTGTHRRGNRSRGVQNE